MTRGKRAKKTDNTKKYLIIAVIAVIIIAIVSAIFSRKTKEESKENTTNSVNIVENEVIENTTQNEVEEPKESLAGKYTMEDSSSIIINNKNVDIELYRLASIKGTIESDENGFLEIKGSDPNNNSITFTFDAKTKILKVKSSKWDYLENGTEFQFK